MEKILIEVIEELDKLNMKKNEIDSWFYSLTKKFNINQWSDFRNDFYPYATQCDYYTARKSEFIGAKTLRLAAMILFREIAFNK